MIYRIIYLVTWAIFLLTNVPLTTFSATTLPDSLLSIGKAYSYCYQSPDTAVAILYIMKERQMEPSWRLMMTEGDIYRKHNHYHAAVDCYNKVLASPEVKDDLDLHIRVLRGLMNCHDMLMDDILLMDDLYQLHKYGEKSDNECYKALANFVMGKRQCLHGSKQNGFSLCLDALEVLKKNDYDNKFSSLRICYGVLVKLYRNDHLFDKAMEMSKLQEQAVREVGPDDIPGERIRDLNYVYGLRASLLAEAGRFQEADIAYEQWKKTNPGNPYDEHEILSYLLMTKRLDEGLSVAERYKNYLRAEGDSVNIRMLDALTYESHIYSLFDDYKRAYDNYAPMASIAYQLHQLSSRKEMSTRYQSLLEKDRLYNRNMWLLGILLTLVGFIVVLGLYVWYRHKVFQKNVSIQMVANQIFAYQKAAIKADQLMENQQPLPTAETEKETKPSEAYVEETPPSSENIVNQKNAEDELLFVQLDKLVTRDKLYLNPSLSRDDLMRLIGVDKNRIGRIMSRYSDTSNLSTYINQKRAYYAANYIKEHPDYTIAAVVNACGMTNTVTLNRAFKEIYGMTPSEYRQQLQGKVSRQA